jgi:hypothetical protein
MPMAKSAMQMHRNSAPKTYFFGAGSLGERHSLWTVQSVNPDQTMGIIIYWIVMLYILLGEVVHLATLFAIFVSGY